MKQPAISERSKLLEMSCKYLDAEISEEYTYFEILLFLGLSSQLKCLYNLGLSPEL